MKKAYSLFELILVIFISSIVLIYSFKFVKEIQEATISQEKTAILKIDINSTKIFIEKNLPFSIEKLKYKGSTLFFDDAILLENITSFSMNKTPNTLTINITVENKISQIWEFKI